MGLVRLCVWANVHVVDCAQSLEWCVRGYTAVCVCVSTSGSLRLLGERGHDHSSWCNTEAQRHHERTCIDMDVIVLQAAFPPIFDQHLFRKALILDIGVCIMEEK